METLVREARSADAEAISRVIRSAFPGPEGEDINDLAGDLLTDPTAEPVLPLVAVRDSVVIGHILFSPVRLDGGDETVSAWILAPLSVVSGCQRQGVGGRLIEEGLARAHSRGIDLVFVLGHPGYYQRHGFVPAGSYNFTAPYPIPEEDADAWMVRAVRRDVPSATGGRVICADSLMDPRHWSE